MFQGFTVEHRQDRTVIYPYGLDFKTICVYLEPDGSYVARSKTGNKLGKLEKTRDKYSLQELQEMCKLVVQQK